MGALRRLLQRGRPKERSESATYSGILQQFITVRLIANQLYGQMRVTLEAAGTPIGPLDTRIAALVLALYAVLVTNNTGEFQRVPGLLLENWAAS